MGRQVVHSVDCRFTATASLATDGWIMDNELSETFHGIAGSVIIAFTANIGINLKDALSIL
jgi:hypothetical protein